MNIESLARVYVDVIEPMLHTMAFVVIGIVLLYLLGVVKDGKKKGDLVNSAFSFIIKMVTLAFTLTGRFLLWMARFSWQIIRVIFASFRDFFTSKI